jgi:hypothetical protein
VDSSTQFPTREQIRIIIEATKGVAGLPFGSQEWRSALDALAPFMDQTGIRGWSLTDARLLMPPLMVIRSFYALCRQGGPGIPFMATTATNALRSLESYATPKPKPMPPSFPSSMPQLEQNQRERLAFLCREMEDRIYSQHANPEPRLSPLIQEAAQLASELGFRSQPVGIQVHVEGLNRVNFYCVNDPLVAERVIVFSYRLSADDSGASGPREMVWKDNGSAGRPLFERWQRAIYAPSLNAANSTNEIHRASGEKMGKKKGKKKRKNKPKQNQPQLSPEHTVVPNPSPIPEVPQRRQFLTTPEIWSANPKLKASAKDRIRKRLAYAAKKNLNLAQWVKPISGESEQAFDAQLVAEILEKERKKHGE